MLYTFTHYATLYELYVGLLRGLIAVAVCLSMLISVDRLYKVFVYMKVQARTRLTGRKPEHEFSARPLPDPAAYSMVYPKVAVQLPMFNERAVCQAIIDSACEMHWPSDRFCVQVLDDSTCKVTRQLVDEKAAEWAERGIKCEVVRRTNRQGYKAGALKDGLDMLADYDYIAIFDADFKPEPDFLMQTVPYLIDNPEVGYVQARWVFANPDESYLTKAQEISLNFHCKCEQFVHFASGSFFNFNGTAGVWRRKTIVTVGGWKSRTTVEDMDLSLRTYVNGWKAVYLSDTTCMNELPASFFAFRKQQHRWTCGPVQLWRRCAGDIWNSSLPMSAKLELLVLYFGIRKFATHWVSLGFFCTLVPLSVFTPEVNIPLWALVHLPVVVTITTAVFTPKGWLHCILYVLFENAMGIVKLWAVIAGVLDLKQAQEWVVTTKLGSSDKRPGTGAGAPAPVLRFYASEMLMSTFVLTAAFYGIFSVNKWSFSIFLTLQGLVFFAFAFNMVDCGGILGGRLGNNVNMHAASLKKAKAAADSYKASSTKGNMVSAARNLSLNGAALKPAYSSIL
ncbi:probable glucomannan 4-beta-mannosyltransferase 9 [Coccomyxa sp. Obi]|nr:probable glucomannan 4-beta-mannosyltransferase 9 [Coccomyxa sp. Obi]